MTAVASALGAIALVAGAFAVIFSTSVRTSRQLWREEAEALKARLATVENDHQQCQSRLEKIETANRVLAETVSGTTAVAMLSKQIDIHFADVKALLGERGPDAPKE